MTLDMNEELQKRRWGFRLHVLPQFPEKTLETMVQSMIAQNKVELPGMGQWTLEQDSALVQLADEFSFQNQQVVTDISPGSLTPDNQLLMKYPQLRDYSVAQMQLRFYFIQQFNTRIRDALPFINISFDDKWVCVGSVMQHVGAGAQPPPAAQHHLPSDEEELAE